MLWLLLLLLLFVCIWFVFGGAHHLYTLCIPFISAIERLYSSFGYCIINYVIRLACFNQITHIHSLNYNHKLTLAHTIPLKSQFLVSESIAIWMRNARIEWHTITVLWERDVVFKHLIRICVRFYCVLKCIHKVN